MASWLPLSAFEVGDLVRTEGLVRLLPGQVWKGPGPGVGLHVRDVFSDGEARGYVEEGSCRERRVWATDSKSGAWSLGETPWEGPGGGTGVPGREGRSEDKALGQGPGGEHRSPPRVTSSWAGCGGRSRGGQGIWSLTEPVVRGWEGLRAWGQDGAIGGGPTRPRFLRLAVPGPFWGSAVPSTFLVCGDRGP